MHSRSTLVLALFTAACGSQAAPMQVEPIECLAAFRWASFQVQGTELESNSEAAELTIRSVYEYERASENLDKQDIETKVLAIAREFNRESATQIAKLCLIEQEMGDDYRRQRPRLINMLDAAGKHENWSSS